MILVIVSLSPIKAFWKGLTWSRTQVIWTYPFLHVFSPQGIFSDFRGFKCPKCKVKPFFILNSFWQFCYVLLPTEGLFVIANSIYNDWRPIQTYMMVCVQNYWAYVLLRYICCTAMVFGWIGCHVFIVSFILYTMYHEDWQYFTLTDKF